ncbi:MAG: pilus assembly protein PilM [Phycisphaerales bacterium]|nr:pilus assembly protein PilM [Phycisphaerae bacterium]NNF43819.1 pilus assembly protein PilM [Phycisphaerales bacterium]NNM27195.1 pilus assembly protein PilM [Phycisphaerales bacterium]
MGLRMFSNATSPIAIEFGTSSVKLLQINAGERPTLTAAAELTIPDSVRLEQDKLNAFYAEKLPKIIAAAGFKSRRAVLAIPSGQSLIQHTQVVKDGRTNRDDAIKSQLHYQLGHPPESLVVRSIEVADVHRDGQVQSEIICFATSRETVMGYVELLKRCKLNVVGVHTEATALVRAFDHITRRESDGELATLFVDIGWGGTLVVISHGRRIVFARHIPIGGRHFDQLIVRTLHCDIALARAHRMKLSGAPEPTVPAPEMAATEGAAILKAAASAHASTSKQTKTATAATQAERREGLTPATSCHPVPDGDPPCRAGNVDLTEPLDTITDELSMCLRYHTGLFPGRAIDRAIFVGGEARQTWLCQHVVKALRVPAQLGDPLSRAARPKSLKTPGLKLDQTQPGWAVAYGLCTAPTDL